MSGKKNTKTSLGNSAGALFWGTVSDPSPKMAGGLQFQTKKRMATWSKALALELQPSPPVTCRKKMGKQNPNSAEMLQYYLQVVSSHPFFVFTIFILPSFEFQHVIFVTLGQLLGRDIARCRPQTHPMSPGKTQGPRSSIGDWSSYKWWFVLLKQIPMTLVMWMNHEC